MMFVINVGSVPKCSGLPLLPAPSIQYVNEMDLHQYHLKTDSVILCICYFYHKKKYI